MSTAKKIPITEFFGPTIQGEGAMQGSVSHFVRTGGCGLRCDWCDSMHSVDPAQIKLNAAYMTTDEIYNAIVALPYAPWVTFTGGDPCMWRDLGSIIPALNMNHKIKVAVETQGQLFPDWLNLCDMVTFSPKPPSSGNIVDVHDLIEFLESTNIPMSQVCIKIVVFDEEDFKYALQAYQRIPDHLYGSFFFTAGTREITTDQVTPGQRVLSTVRGMQGLSRMVLGAVEQGIVFNDDVRIGCQQHVLLWPAQDKGV